MSQAENTATPYAPGLWERIIKVLKTEKTGQIAKRLKISPSSVSDWKHGRTTPSLDKLHEIAFYGETTIEWLMKGEGSSDMPGDTIYFDTWLLPTSARHALVELAKQQNIDSGKLAQKILIEALDQRAAKPRRALINLDEDGLKELIREVVREEQTKQSPVAEDTNFLLDRIETLPDDENKYLAFALPPPNGHFNSNEMPQEVGLLFKDWDKLSEEDKAATLKQIKEIVEDKNTPTPRSNKKKK